MQLHEKTFKRNLARRLAPLFSSIIIRLKLTALVRQLIAFLSYCLGRGCGMGWSLSNEVDVAVSCIHRESPIVFDVGGNIGEWSDEFRKRVSGGRLFIFEPQLTCQKLIRDRHIPNSEVICSAVGKEAGESTFYSSSETDGSASLYPRGETFFEDKTYKTQTVAMISLDDFASERGLDFVDYVKFDIEGHELHALEGFQSYLSSRRVGAFSFEFGSGNLNSRTIFRDFWNLLHENYSIYIITPSGKLEEITGYYEDLEFYRGVSNFIAKLRPNIDQTAASSRAVTAGAE